MRFPPHFWLHPQAVYMKLLRPTDGNFYTFVSLDTVVFKVWISDP